MHCESVRMRFTLQFFPPRIDEGSILGELAGYAEQFEIVGLKVHVKKKNRQHGTRWRFMATVKRNVRPESSLRNHTDRAHSDY
ncbi:hypothetical protein SAMN05192589_101102 [Paracidovorax valerianellae]|uniref:Uncharacterized protein n=1 Tax=Paracidovorax valerianellae TaxID=187868 RepID=A0A1G6I9X3_9BURK|nr:hypothetical protein SAMN05192589_101102 [Paracidovorax valerianellae]